VRQHCSFAAACRLIFALTRLILAHFNRRGTALFSRGTCSGWPRPRAATVGDALPVDALIFVNEEKTKAGREGRREDK